MPKISVIVPVYKAENTLHRCVDSILAQTFTDFELLLIDDGSPDRSGAICDEYEEKDPRVKVFHKPNGGVSSARNLGLDNAEGEWISFVDSDDWIDHDYLYELFKGTTCDLSICNYKIEDSSIKWEFELHNGIQNTGDITELFSSGGFQGCAFMGPVCKLFNRQILKANNIQFIDNIDSGEDSIFSMEYFCHIVNYYGINKKLYHYWHPDNGLSQHSKLADNFISFGKEAIRLSEVLSTTFHFDQECFLYNFLYGGFNAFLNHIILEKKLCTPDIKELYSVWPPHFYDKYVSNYGRLIKASRFFYKHKYFKVLQLYLKLLKKFNHPFFLTTTD